MKLSNLANNLRKYGLTVVEVAGWQNRGYAGQDLQDIRGVVWHHTATPRSNYNYSDAPTLNLCVNGRSDLPGPLCQIVFGRTGIVYVIAAGVGNHAGVGNAWNVPTNAGNHYMIGIEMESSGIAPYDWTEDQKRVAPYLGAALELSYLQDDAAQIQVAHYEYSTEGKIDPAGWPGGMDGLRNSINAKIAELTGGTKAPAVPAPTKPAAPAPGGKYVPDPHWLVEKGETLGQIADWAKVSVGELARFNGIKDVNRINVGERVWSPRAGFDTWTVDPGDTLARIADWYAAKHGHRVSVEQLKNANGINNPSTETKVGLRLLIP